MRCLQTGNARVWYPDRDFGKYEDLIQRLYIQEEVIESELIEKRNNANPEPYSVKIEDDKIFVSIRKKDYKEGHYADAVKNFALLFDGLYLSLYFYIFFPF